MDICCNDLDPTILHTRVPPIVWAIVFCHYHMLGPYPGQSRLADSKLIWVGLTRYKDEQDDRYRSHVGRTICSMIYFNVYLDQILTSLIISYGPNRGLYRARRHN
jgi:hypothetical protein